MRTLVLAGLCILGGCGTAPPEAAPVAPSPALAANPTTQNAAPQTAAPADEKEEFKPPAGYKTKIAGWEVVYCTKTAVLGTRFKKELCMNEAELKAHMARNEEMRDDLREVGKVCSQAAGCAMN
jgi:hypothetical protein